jgi:hypothetical protein
MKSITLPAIFLVLFVSYAEAGEPYVKTVFKNKNWSVIQVGVTGEFRQCALRSAPNYLEPGVPKYGSVYLEVSYPSNNLTLSGENIPMYFKISKKSTLQIGSGASVGITPETPMPGKAIVDSMLAGKGKVAKVEIDFGGGDPSVHKFPMAGFAEAYKMLPECVGRR